ncbi:hypothetical protein Pam4_62 [Pseudanabaena phage Pam4]|nr:hypothetical protein Pam4_62 [Pseudanabaena phage Pam4]
MTTSPYVPTTADPEVAVARSRAAVILQDHRRLQNCRSCSGCGWRPSRSGRTGEPETMRQRHAEFNAHLAALLHPGDTGA